jgi:hypothetical protein
LEGLNAEQEIAQQLPPRKADGYVVNKWDARRAMNLQALYLYVTTLMISKEVHLVSRRAEGLGKKSYGNGCSPFYVKGLRCH